MNASLKDLSQALLEGRPDALLRRALEHWPGPALLFDALLRLRWCSPAARALIECTAGESVGAGIEDLRLPWPLEPEDFDAVLAGQSVELDGPALGARDGRHHVSGVRLLPLAPGEGGGVLCCEAPAPTLDTGETLPTTQHSFDAAQAGAWRWDFPRGESVIDARWCEALDLDPFPGPAHQERWEQQIHPDDLQAYQQRRAELQRGSSARFESEYRVLTRSHEWVWVLQRGRVTRRDGAGRPLQAIGLCIDIDRRKREETAARANESRLATALWGARAAFWQWHVPTDGLTLSPMWFAMLQYTREQWESIANPWDSRVHPEDMAAVNAAVSAFHDGRSESLEYEYRMRTGSGEWRWLVDRGRAVEWDPDGHPVVVMGVTLDIDAQKQAELELRASQDRLKTAVWGARMGLWELDFGTERTVWFNDWCAQNDIDPCDGEDHVDRWDASIHPDDVAEAARRFAEHVAGKSEYYDAEYRVRTRGGRWVWVFERSLVVERDAGGAARRMVGICMDITARREEELRQHFAQPWVELALEAGRGGMWYWDAASRASQATDTYYRMLGFDPQEGRSRPRFWYSRVHPEDRERIRPDYAALVAGRNELLDVEYRIQRADGNWIWVRDRARAQARGADGHATSIVGFTVDVSEDHAARAALSASDERFRLAARAVRGLIYDSDLASGNVSRFGADSLIGLRDPELGTTRAEYYARVHPEDLPRLLASRARSIAPGEVSEVEYRVRHLDGHWVHVLDRSITLRDATGMAHRRIGFVQDISERQREREALQAQAQVLATLDVGVALLDPGLHVQITNAAFDAGFGAAAGQLGGQPLRALVVADEAQWRRICDEMAAVDDLHDSAIDLTCRRTDGTAFQCQALLRALPFDGERHIILAVRGLHPSAG